MGGWMPGAKTFGGPAANNDGDRGGPVAGMILHVNAGPDGSLWGRCNDNSSNMSTTFQVRLDGTIEQYLPLNLIQWCQMNGNRRYGSIEVPDFPQNPMNAAQLNSIARILRWASESDGFPIQLNMTDPDNGFGLGWHGMGGAGWGDHPFCPGEIRKAQMPQIVALALGNPVQEEFTVSQYDDIMHGINAVYAVSKANLSLETVVGNAVNTYENADQAALADLYTQGKAQLAALLAVSKTVSDTSLSESAKLDAVKAELDKLFPPAV